MEMKLLRRILERPAHTIAAAIILAIPLIGTYIHFFAFGGEFPGEAFIPRLYTIHVLLLPAILWRPSAAPARATTLLPRALHRRRRRALLGWDSRSTQRRRLLRAPGGRSPRNLRLIARSSRNTNCSLGPGR